MAGYSKSTRLITVRLPNAVLATIYRRAEANNVPAHEYLRDRIVYDTTRKHNRRQNGKVAD